MDAAPTTEIAKPQQEVKKPQEGSGEKGSPILDKFQKAQSKFTSMFAGIKQAVDKATQEAPHVAFDAEQHELNQLYEKLAKLNQDFAHALDTSLPKPGSAGESAPVQTWKEIGTSTGPNEEITETSLSPTNEKARAALFETTRRPVSPRAEDDRQREAPLRIPRAADRLQDLQDKAKSEQLERRFALKGFLGDSDKIEGHQIDFIHQGIALDHFIRGKIPIGSLREAEKRLTPRTFANFKMPPAMIEKFNDEVLAGISPEKITNGTYDFQFVDGQTSRTKSNCWIIQVDENTTIYVSKGERAEECRTHDYTKPILDKAGNFIGFEDTGTITRAEPVRALIGAVRIEVKELTNVGQIAQKFETAFQELKINEALVNPDRAAEDKYKEARFRWQHRLEDPEAYEEYTRKFKEENGVELVDHLQREEVFPEYFTIVDKGASEVYQKEGKIFLTHRLWNLDDIVPIVKYGLLSSHERFKWGISTQGLSTERDFETGGADSVFIRAFPENAGNDKVDFDRPTILINPQVLDRTDWYAYKYDSYGTTEPGRFDARPSPEVFLAEQRQFSTSKNEIMMRRGIPPEMISGVVVRHETDKSNLITKLQAAGLQEINGVPLDQFISVHSNFSDLKRANGIETPDTTKKPDDDVW